VPDREKLLQIVDDPKSSETERAEAWQDLNALDSVSPQTSPAVDHLVRRFLHDTHTSTLGDVPHYALHQFLTELGMTTPDANSLYQRWLDESPVAGRKMKQMGIHLANCFLDQQDALAARLQSATAQGLNTVAIRREMKKLYQDWVDSSIFNEHPEIRHMMRDAIAHKL